MSSSRTNHYYSDSNIVFRPFAPLKVQEKRQRKNWKRTSTQLQPHINCRKDSYNTTNNTTNNNTYCDCRSSIVSDYPMFGSPVHQGYKTAVTAMSMSRFGPLSSAVEDGSDSSWIHTELPGTPMKTTSTDEEQQRKKSLVDEARRKKFDDLFRRVESEVLKIEKQPKKRTTVPKSQSATSVQPFEVVPFEVPLEVVKEESDGSDDDSDNGETSGKETGLTTPDFDGVKMVSTKEQLSGRSSSHSAPLVAWHDPNSSLSPSTSRVSPRLVLVQALSEDPSIIPAPTPYRPKYKRVTRFLDDVDEDEGENESYVFNKDDFYSSEDDDDDDEDEEQDIPYYTHSTTTTAPSKKNISIRVEKQEEEEYVSDYAQPEFIVTQTSTNLQISAANGNAEEIARLLADEGHTVDEEDEQGRTALLYAVHCNQLEMVAFLLTLGANVNHKSADGATPLHRAAFCGTKAMIMLLLSNGADNRVVDEEGRLPLHWSAHNPNIKCMSALLKKVPHSMVNKADNAGMTALLWSAYYDRVGHFKKLLRNKADPTVSDQDGKKAIHWAACAESGHVFRSILTEENSLLTDNVGMTCAHYAAELGNKKIMKAIVSLRPASVKDVDANGRTPLHYASVCNKPLLVRYLLKHHALVTAVDNLGNSAMDYAVEKDCAQCVSLLTLALEGKPLTVEEQTEEISEAVSNNVGLAVDEDGVLAPSADVQALFELLARGTYLLKYTNNGKGSAHYRYFWIDMLTGEVCWMKNHKDFKTNPKSVEGQALTSVIGHPSMNVRNRSDFDPDGQHRYAFTINTAGRKLDVIAPSEPIFLLWVHGVRCLFLYRDNLLRAVQDRHQDELKRKMVDDE
eukprot:m.114968 g.114968  ORF g.114968 m.114968 type:complete len:848 (+) comp12833_c2_seq12:105-2648(+)